jgi:hypothetical protein
MAVVQISRIQVRRGRAQTGTGVPTLASGELGWAVDTRELYIGNGSVSEGAPTVGNTRILTEFSDILGEAARYAYKREEINTAAGGDLERNLQDKLDDFVNVRDFGAAGDGTIQREALQRAIDALYLGANKGLFESRVSLYMPAGEYKIDAPLYLPPYTRIVGDGINATYILNTGNASNIFVTVNSNSTPGNPELDASTTDTGNQPRNINISGMTLVDPTSGDQPASASALVAHSTLLMNCAKDCVFEDVEFRGLFDPTTDNPYINDDINQGLKDSTAIKMYATSSALNCTGNIFRNCVFKNYVSSVYSDYDVENNTWDYCSFSEAWHGIVFGYETNPTADVPGQFTGPVNNRISNSRFQDIWQEAVLVREGVDNVSENNRYADVGNEGGGSATPVTAVIRFGYKKTETANPRYDPKFHVGNKSINDYFDRTADLTVNPAFNINAYPPEVEGAKFLELDTEIQTRLGTSGNNTVAVADISQADPCVVRTVTNHNLTNGQQVLLTGLVGMGELEGRTFFVNVVDDDEFELYNDAGLTSSEDSSLYTPYGSEGAVVGSVRTYFLQLPADQRKGTTLIDYVYNGVLSTNEINRKGTFKLIYDLDANQLSFNEDFTATGNPFFANLLTFNANLDVGNNKITMDFVNTGFSIGSDVDNFRFTIKHIV